MAVVLLLLTVPTAWAQPALGEQGGVEVRSGTTSLESAAGTLNFQDSDFVVSCTAGECAISMATTFVECANGLVSGTCFANPTVMPYPIVGGSTTSDVVKINPTSSTTYGASNTVEVCEGAGSAVDLNNTSPACLTIFPDGISIGGNLGLAYGIKNSPVVTQGADALLPGVLPGYVGIYMAPNLTVSDSSLGNQDLGVIYGVLSSPSMTVASDDTWSNGVIRGFFSQPNCTETSTGTIVCATIESFLSNIAAPSTAGATITRAIDFHATDLNGTLTGTATDHFGFLAEAFTKGTQQFQYGAVEHTIAGTVPSGFGVWGVETGSPDRFYFKNESGHIWRTGWMTFTGRGTALATTAVTRFFPVFTSAAADATETNVDAGAPGAITCYAMTCGLNVAAGAGTDAHAITLMDDTATTSLTCTITTTASTCNVRVEAGVSIAAPSLVDYRDVTTDTPAANEITCSLVCNLGAW